MRDLGACPTLPLTYHRRYPSPVHHDNPCNQSAFCGREFEEEREGVSSASPFLFSLFSSTFSFFFFFFLKFSAAAAPPAPSDVRAGCDINSCAKKTLIAHTHHLERGLLSQGLRWLLTWNTRCSGSDFQSRDRGKGDRVEEEG